MTLIEQIISAHSDSSRVHPGETVWIGIDYRSARDFGGPSVVQSLAANFADAPVSDPARTFFTFDTNAPANTTGYADNQHQCRLFARKWGVKVYDVDAGIGTHVAMEKGLVKPGDTAVGTDSHFNILAAVGAFGQGMGDLDVAYIFKTGKTWFEVPPTIRIRLKGKIAPESSAKDIALFLLRELGTEKALGKSVEIYGESVNTLDLSGRITLCSLATEAGAISFFLPPSQDSKADYESDLEYDISSLPPMVSPPPNPNGAVPASELKGVRIDSVFVGSCTNGRWEDFRVVADILRGQRVKEDVMLRMVPATRAVYERILDDGTMADLVKAGAIVTHPGCGGCASGQIGMTGKGETQVSTSNRNFRGKQGLGDTYLASPRTAALAAVKGEM